MLVYVLGRLICQSASFETEVNIALGSLGCKFLDVIAPPKFVLLRIVSVFQL